MPFFTAARIVYVVLYAMAVIMLAAYSAALISFLTVQTTAVPFVDLEGMLEQGKYKLGVEPNTAEWELFMSASSGILQKVYHRLLKESYQPKTREESIVRMCEDSSFVMFLADGVLWGMPKIACLLDAVDTQMLNLISFVAAKNNPYFGVLNYNLQRLQDGGILQILRERQWSTSKSPAPLIWSSVEINDIVPILVSLSAVALISILVLLTERKIRSFKATP